ncbi:MAG: DUF6599 family protein [candidate division Zixibacteria bacterium]|nr:DUF6599 family protein [candidate division Zixibacteria bacterium]
MIKRTGTISICSLLAILTISLLIPLACGGEKNATGQSTAIFLPQEFGAIGMVRTSPVRTFSGETLWEYVNGGAELYHSYSFVEVSTADYEKRTTEIIADIYCFSSGLNAWGMYSMLRPDNADIVRIGTQGYLTPSNLQFVKGTHLVNLVTYENSDETNLALLTLADELDRLLPDPSESLSEFSVFPDTGRVQGTDKYWVKSFLGHKFLTNVYSRDFILDSGRVTLFMSENQPGKMLLEWSQLATQTSNVESAPDDLSFDNDMAFVSEDSFYGQIIVGTCNGILVGMVGYDIEYRGFFADWMMNIN